MPARQKKQLVPGVRPTAGAQTATGGSLQDPDPGEGALGLAPIALAVVLAALAVFMGLYLPVALVALAVFVALCLSFGRLSRRQQVAQDSIPADLLQEHATFLKAILQIARREPQVQVIVSPRGFGKSTLARAATLAAGTATAGHFGLKPDELVQYLNSGDIDTYKDDYSITLDNLTITKFINLDLKPLGLRVNMLALNVLLSVAMKLLYPILAPCSKVVIILDDVLVNYKEAKDVTNFFQKATALRQDRRVSAIVMFTSNEGIVDTLMDASASQDYMVVNTLVPHSIATLTKVLDFILRRAQSSLMGGVDQRSFLLNTINQNAVRSFIDDRRKLKAAVELVIATLPARHAFSLRVWDLILRNWDEPSTLQNVLVSTEFLLKVLKLDIGASAGFREQALTHSPALPEQDRDKLAKWVSSAYQVPTKLVDARMPGRLALLWALCEVEESEAMTCAMSLPEAAKQRVSRPWLSRD